MTSIILNLRNIYGKINSENSNNRLSQFRGYPVMQNDSFERSFLPEDDNNKDNVNELVVYYYSNDEYDGYLTFGTPDGSASLCAHYNLDCPDSEPKCTEDEPLQADLILDYIKEDEKLTDKDAETFIKQKQSGNTETEFAARIIGPAVGGRYKVQIDGIPSDIYVAYSDATKYKEGDIIKAKGLLDCEFHED